MAAIPVLAIPDIHIGRVYHRRDPECDVHYETFGTLAQFFGRNTPMHRHKVAAKKIQTEVAVDAELEPSATGKDDDAS